MSAATSLERSAPSSAMDRRTVTLLFLTLMVVMLLASLSQMVLSSALPTLVGELNGVEHLSWVITAYLLAATVTMPIYGKVSDLLGRKPLLLTAVSFFIAGSVLGGLAQDMTMLIVARAVQGLGGGGLMVLSQAAIADVVPARERGRYMGILGGVFAFSSVAGPLLGGWFTEGPGWRWTFWMNVPLGALALVAIAILLRVPRPARAGRARIDYPGMVLLTLATSGVVLTATWGGTQFEWESPTMIALIVGSVITAGLFVLVERRSLEPVIPLRLFRARNFVLATLAGMLVSVAMFGAMSYMPTYFQMAAGATATEAGLLMIPMMATFLTTSIVVGVVISRTGRYKLIPIIGSLVLALGLGLLSTAGLDTPIALVCTWMAIIGIGLGTSMQVMTLIVQNTFAHRQVGTATAAQNYFRQVGGTLGTAIVGSVFAARLADLLSARLPADSASGGGSPDAASLTPELVAGLPDALRTAIVSSYNDALIPVYLVMVPLALAAAAVLVFLIETPLATTISREGAEQVAPLESDAGEAGDAQELPNERGSRLP